MYWLVGVVPDRRVFERQYFIEWQLTGSHCLELESRMECVRKVRNLLAKMYPLYILYVAFSVDCAEIFIMEAPPFSSVSLFNFMVFHGKVACVVEVRMLLLSQQISCFLYSRT